MEISELSLWKNPTEILKTYFSNMLTLRLLALLCWESPGFKVKIQFPSERLL